MESMIDGVEIIPLKKIPDERGTIMHMLRCDDKHFEKFGEIYFSKTLPGAIKGWHIHEKMALNYAVIFGMIKLVLYDSREGSATKGNLMELFLGDDNYILVKIPPGVINGHKVIGNRPAILANCATEAHYPKNSRKIDPFTKDIPYDWGIRHQ